MPVQKDVTITLSPETIQRCEGLLDRAARVSEDAAKIDAIGEALLILIRLEALRTNRSEG